MYYLKKSIFLIFYTLIFSVMQLGIISISITSLKIILTILALLFYLFLTSSFFFYEGKTAYKVRHENDNKRRIIIKTGEYVKLEKKAEYSFYKGFLIVFIAFAPLIVLEILNVIAINVNEKISIFSSIIKIMDMLFYSPIFEALGETSPYYILITLYAVPLMMLIVEVSYVLGAKANMRKYDAIDEMRKEIHERK